MRCLIAILLCMAFPGCTTLPPGRPMGEMASEINATLTRSAVVLAPGDVISVVFPRLPAWNQAGVVIQTDGSASFLSLDTIGVAGLTLAELDAKLTDEYTKILAQPELTVRTTQMAPRNIVIMGEVVGPGTFEIPAGRLTLLEALGLANGHIRDTALLEHTLLVRWIPGEDRVQAWRIDASTENWTGDESILLQAHDVIFIPAQAVVHVNDWVDRYLRRMIPFPYLVNPN
jgi:polysaccharide export outer membrane protein